MMEILPLPQAPSKGRSTRCSRPQSSRLRHKIDDTYSYFTREVDPIIAACVSNFLFRQPMEVLDAMKLYFHNVKNSLDKDCFEEVDCFLPKKDQKIYFTHYLGPQLSKIVDAIATSQPADVMDFICRFLMEQRKTSGVPMAVPITFSPISVGSSQVKTDSSSTARNKISEAILLASEIENNNDTGRNNTQTQSNDISSGNLPANKVQSNDDLIPKSSNPITGIAKSIQISILGMDGGGKTSIINALQGNFSTKMKHSLGFKPTTMQLGESINVKFYDLGGGKKIRDIWSEYYHDVHAVIYVFDASQTGDELQESIQLFQSTISNPFLLGKPLLILANKNDKNGALTSSDLSELLNLKQVNSAAIISDCSSYVSLSNLNCFISSESSEIENSVSDQTLDPRLESALEQLLSRIQSAFIDLDTRVTTNITEKKNMELKKRFERERKVLKNKIASAFRDVIDPELLPENLPPKGEDDSFTKQEGLVFIAGEIGVEVDALEEVRTFRD